MLEIEWVIGESTRKYIVALLMTKIVLLLSTAFIYTLLNKVLMKTKIILVFIKPEDGIEKISRNVVSFLQYYSAS
jgi:hypothetical protein